jgi:hypothetical protein
MFGLATGLATGSNATRRIIGGLAGGCVGGLVYAAADIPKDGLATGLAFGLANGAVTGLTVALAANLAHDHRPERIHVRLAVDQHRLKRLSLAGLTFGVALALAGSVAIDTVTGLLGGMAVGLLTVLMAAMRTMLSVPADITRAVSPALVWRTDHASAITFGLTLGIFGGLTVGAVAAAVSGAEVGFNIGIQYGLIYACAAACSTAWYRFCVARIQLRVRGALPWHVLEFLADAHHRGLLRQAGAVYQFRHARLQDRLVATARRKSHGGGDLTGERDDFRGQRGVGTSGPPQQVDLTWGRSPGRPVRAPPVPGRRSVGGRPPRAHRAGGGGPGRRAAHLGG